MDPSVPGRRVNPGLKASLAELFAALKGAAVRGVVPRHVFLNATEELGLSEVERHRLIEELARMDVFVKKAVHSSDTDSPAGEEVVPSRVDIARRLLERFADREGRITGRAAEGVARLAGLSDHEADQLRVLVVQSPSSDRPGGEIVDEGF